MSLEFDPETHTYRKGGQLLPSVTEILRDAGIIDPSRYAPGSALRGTRVHHACHQLVTGTLDWASLDEEPSGYVCSLDELLRTTGAEVVESELRVHTDEFAGTLDLVLRLHGELAICDLKSGRVEPWCKLQTAAYAHAFEVCTGQRVNRRFGVALQADGSCAKLSTPYTDPSDLEYFRAALRIYQGKRNGWAPIVTHRPVVVTSEAKVVVYPESATEKEEQAVGEAEAVGVASSRPAPAEAPPAPISPVVSTTATNVDRPPPLPAEIVIDPEAGERTVLMKWLMDELAKVRPGMKAHNIADRCKLCESLFGTARLAEIRALPLEKLRAGIEAIRKLANKAEVTP